MAGDGFSEARAELFEALGHPIRVRILEALEARSMGFAELKKHVGIESSGHLQFHLRKLGSLLRDEDGGTYALSDEGRETLRVLRATAQWGPRGNRGKVRVLEASKKAVAIAGLLVFLVLLAAFAASGGIIYSFQNQLNAYPAASYRPGSWYTIQFNGTGGNWVDFNIELSGLPAVNQSQQVVPVQIQVAHAEGISLDSLKLQFERTSVGCCWAFDSVEYGGAGGYPPPSARLSGMSGVATLDLEDFGFVGTGSVNVFLNLVLDNASQFQIHSAQSSNASIGLVIVMQLHDASRVLVTNNYNGYAYVSMTPHANGLVTIDRPPFFKEPSVKG